VLKFNDYQCPACGQTYEEYKRVLAKYATEHPGVLQFMVKDYPLEGECNRFAPGGSHTGACEAAVAVRLAREQGKADEMEAWLYGNQPLLNPETVRRAAREVGGVTDFDERYEATLELVKADVALGGQLDVRGTPTFFMNGLRLPGLRAEFFDAAIQWELQRVRAAGSSVTGRRTPRTVSSGQLSVQKGTFL
jgi:protein-disulfide isomerase